MKLDIYHFLFALTLCICSFSYGEAKSNVLRFNCANTTVKPNLNLTRLTGEWYEIARTPNKWENGVCTQITQKLTPDRSGLRMYWEEIIIDKTLKHSYKYAISIGKPPTEGPAAKLGIRFTIPDQNYTLPFHVIDTDYTEFMLIYSCYPVFDIFNFPNAVFFTENAWMLSRKRKLTIQKHNDLKYVLQRNDVAAHWMEIVNQKNCSDLYSTMSNRLNFL